MKCKNPLSWSETYSTKLKKPSSWSYSTKPTPLHDFLGFKENSALGIAQTWTRDPSYIYGKGIYMSGFLIKSTLCHVSLP